MNITDTHLHAHTYKLEEGIKFLDILSGKGVKKAAFMSTTLTSANLYETVNIENTYCLWLKKEYKKSDIYVFGAIHETGAFGEVPFEQQLEYLMKTGCDGIKLLNMKPNIRKALGKGLNHPSYDKLFTLLEEKQIPALVHSKDPAYFWYKDKMLPEQVEYGWCYEGEGFASYEQIHRETLEMMDKHPRLKLILAHFFFLDDNLKEAERIMEKYPNVLFDVTPHSDMFVNFSKDTEAWRKFFIKYSDRIMFGSDADDRRDKKTIDEIFALVDASINTGSDETPLSCYDVDMVIKGLNLPQDIVEKIFYGNFVRLMGEKPRETDSTLLKNMAEYAYNKLKGVPGSERDAEFLKYFLHNN